MVWLRRRKYLLWRVLPWLIWMGLIFFFSSRNGSQVNSIVGAPLQPLQPLVPAMSRHTPLIALVMQKAAHFFGYAVLAVLALRVVQPVSRWRPAFTAWVLAVLYSFTDEWHQSFVPSRSPSLWDIGIDAAGAVFGLAVFWTILYIAKRRGNTPADKAGLYWHRQ